MSKINWTRVVVFGLVALVVFLVGASLVWPGWGWGWGSQGNWGPGRMVGPGMMGGWGFGPFGWLGMIFMWLFPLGFLALLVLGVVWLLRQVSGPSRPFEGPFQAPAGGTCPNCGRSVQADWQHCPHCGRELSRSTPAG